MRRVISIFCFLVMFILCGELIEYFFVDDTSLYTRIMMQEMYSTDENIDVLFVGSSHAYRSFDTEITDEIFGAKTFNVGTSSQEMDSSLALIKEVTKNNDVKRIYLEMYYIMGMVCDWKARSAMIRTYIISDYMEPSLNKVEYLLEASNEKHYANSFIPARRNWEKVFDDGYIKNLLKRKSTDIYKDYKYDYVTYGNERYCGNGYVANYQETKDGTFFKTSAFSPIDTSKFSSDWLRTLEEIIDYCEKENIELTFICTPMPNFTLVGVGNYGEYVDYINCLIEGTDVKYYDFNLCKEQYFQSDSTIYLDDNHLNDKGAKIFSTIFSEFFTGKISEEELFYSSYEEKLKHTGEDVFGTIIEEKNNTLTISSVLNVDMNRIKYDIIFSPEGGNVVEHKGISNPEISYPEKEKGVVEVITYMDNKEECRVTYEYGKK